MFLFRVGRRNDCSRGIGDCVGNGGQNVGGERGGSSCGGSGGRHFVTGDLRPERTQDGIARENEDQRRERDDEVDDEESAIEHERYLFPVARHF